MSFNISPLLSVSLEWSSWNVKVRLLHSVIVHEVSNSQPHTVLHLLFVDANGTRIQGRVVESLLSKFKHLLCEGVAYTITSIQSVPNTGKFRWTPHPCLLSFAVVTQVKPEHSGLIPNQCFSFGSIDSVFMPFFTSDILRDVIGVLTSVENELGYIKDDVSTPAVMLELSDQYGTFDCCLFSDHVDQFNQYFSLNTCTQTVVVI